MTEYVYRGACDFEGIVCPFGCSAETAIENLGTTSTLIGWMGGEDPNHHSTACLCKGCDQKFTKEFVPRGRKVWYTALRDNHVLLGKPGCCENNYLIPCECGGWKKHSNGGGIYSTRNINGVWIPEEPRYWECQNCHQKGPDHEYGWKYMDRESIEKAIKQASVLPTPESHKLKLNWKVKEKIGMAVINPRGVTKGNKTKIIK